MTEALRDWVTVWHSEWAAMAVDRELHEAGQRAAAAWALAALAILDASGPARSPAPPGAAPAAAAPDGGVLAALERRVRELEQQLARRQ